MKKKILSALGLMSGTSMDGVDLSLIKSDGNSNFTHVFDDYFEFDLNLRQNLMNLRDKILNLDDLKKYSKELDNLEREFTLFNAQIIENIIKKNDYQIDLIGFHGQTIFHNSKRKISKQLGDGKLLSQLTKKVVINDFRKQDIINGGQGAPLTPVFHKLISKFLNEKNKVNNPINIINIGGITNITQIKDSDSINSSIKAFDIAPGNCLIDEWIRKNSSKKFDKDGLIAKSGKVNNLILNQALDNFNFFKPNMSLDIKDFDISFVKGLSLEDGCATLTKFTANLISQGIEYMNNTNKCLPNYNLICGGGRKNDFLIKSIDESITQKNNQLKNIDQYGLNGDFIESQAFGYIAIRSFLNLPISFPNTTGCKSPTPGGTINKNF